MIDSSRFFGWIAALQDWWRSQLEASLPDALRPSPRASRIERLLIRPEDQVVSITLMSADGREIFVERTTWADYTRVMLDRCRRRAAKLVHPRNIVVSLALPQAVGRSMLIPRRARDQAEQIVRDHISRKTPLPIEEIFIAWGAETANAGKLTVSYIALPKTLLERTFKRLLVSPSEISTIESNGAYAVPLASPAPTKSSRMRRMTSWLASVSLAATLGGFCILAFRQDALLAELDDQLSQLAEPARQSAEQARIFAKRGEDLATLSKLRNVPGVVRIWEELAEILPSSSYLTELDITESGLQLSGFSESTPALIRFLESSAMVRHAALSGPITFDSAAGKERFSIQASLKVPRAPLEERD
jgi:Tfp pilus assembly protein PilN